MSLVSVNFKHPRRQPRVVPAGQRAHPAAGRHDEGRVLVSLYRELSRLYDTLGLPRPGEPIGTGPDDAICTVIDSREWGTQGCLALVVNDGRAPWYAVWELPRNGDYSEFRPHGSWSDLQTAVMYFNEAEP